MNTDTRTLAIKWWYSLNREEREKYPEDSHDPYMPNEIEYLYKMDVQGRRNDKIDEILNKS